MKTTLGFFSCAIAGRATQPAPTINAQPSASKLLPGFISSLLVMLPNLLRSAKTNSSVCRRALEFGYHAHAPTVQVGALEAMRRPDQRSAHRLGHAEEDDHPSPAQRVEMGSSGLP